MLPCEMHAYGCPLCPAVQPPSAILEPLLPVRKVGRQRPSGLTDISHLALVVFASSMTPRRVKARRKMEPKDANGVVNWELQERTHTATHISPAIWTVTSPRLGKTACNFYIIMSRATLLVQG